MTLETTSLETRVLHPSARIDLSPGQGPPGTEELGVSRPRRTAVADSELSTGGTLPSRSQQHPQAAQWMLLLPSAEQMAP